MDWVHLSTSCLALLSFLITVEKRFGVPTLLSAPVHPSLDLSLEVAFFLGGGGCLSLSLFLCLSQPLCFLSPAVSAQTCVYKLFISTFIPVNVYRLCFYSNRRLSFLTLWLSLSLCASFFLSWSLSLSPLSLSPALSLSLPLYTAVAISMPLSSILLRFLSVPCQDLVNIDLADAHPYMSDVTLKLNTSFSISTAASLKSFVCLCCFSNPLHSQSISLSVSTGLSL